MAKSPSHKYGQLIGNMLEKMFTPIFQKVADDNNLYLDYVGKTRSARPGKKVSWEDRYGSTHDLDFVFEFTGDDRNFGRPAAFVETAWRRYTKHSKNKVQEIQAALLPIAEKHKNDVPFLGAILAGKFTAPSLTQIQSSKFDIIYIDYDVICHAFQAVGVDAAFEEDTPEDILKSKVSRMLELSTQEINIVQQEIFKSIQGQVDAFKTSLVKKITKKIKRIVVYPLYSKRCEFSSIATAKTFIESFQENSPDNEKAFYKYDLIVEYLNGDEVRGSFKDKNKALSLLDSVLSD